MIMPVWLSGALRISLRLFHAGRMSEPALARVCVKHEANFHRQAEQAPPTLRSPL